MMKPDIFRNIAFALVVLASALVCYVNTGPNSFARYIISTFVKGEKPHMPHIETDTFFTRAVPEGNILLQFTGFDAENPRAPKTPVAFVYYRSGYTLYPRRVFVADHTMVINKGADIINSNFDPDEEWLDRNDIHSVVEVEYSPQRGIQYRVEQR